jgi:hypothetical protein
VSPLALTALLVVPLAILVAGFALAARAMLRSDAAPTITEEGRPVLRYAARARLHVLEGAPAIPGMGTLMLTDHEVVFERFFPRRELRVRLDRLTSALEERGVAGEQLLVLRWSPTGRGAGEGARLGVPDPSEWIEAIREAGRRASQG